MVVDLKRCSVSSLLRSSYISAKQSIIACGKNTLDVMLIVAKRTMIFKLRL